MWWGDWSPDIHNSDKNALIYESEILKRDVEIVGFPKVKFQTEVTAPQTHFIARLSDVSPDSSVTLVTGAGKNGSHLSSSSDPIYLIPGEEYEVEIELHFTTWTFKEGHKIRLSLSNGQWPMIWPNPEILKMTVTSPEIDPSYLILPVLVNSDNNQNVTFLNPGKDPKLKGFETSQFGTASGFAEISDSHFDPASGIHTVTASNSGEVIYPWAKWTTDEKIIHRVNISDPAEAGIESEYGVTVDTGKEKLKWTGILEFTSDPENFYYNYTRNLFRENQLIRTKNWKETIPRDHQ